MPEDRPAHQPVNLRLRMAYKALPDNAVEKLAGELQGMGFEVHSATPLGIHFTAEKAAFEKTFQCQTDAEGKRLLGEPKLPSMLQVSEAAVYMPTKPLRF